MPTSSSTHSRYGAVVWVRKRIIAYSLFQLANSLSQNCGAKIHRELASRSFTDAVLRLANDRVGGDKHAIRLRFDVVNMRPEHPPASESEDPGTIRRMGRDVLHGPGSRDNGASIYEIEKPKCVASMSVRLRS